MDIRTSAVDVSYEAMPSLPGLKYAGHIYPSPILQLPFIRLTLACCMAVCRCRYRHPANLGLVLIPLLHLMQRPAVGIAPERSTLSRVKSPQHEEHV